MMKKMMKKEVYVSGSEVYPFHNAVDYCIGTGRMGLALHKEYYEQLKMVQDEIGFKHIRGHGLFCDDMAIYQEYEENGQIRVEYNFTYVDRVMDSYLELGLRPFLELGFMPEKLASGTQTFFYWKCNVTPPKSYETWQAMVQALLRHLMERYGIDEVVTWPVEVWNEPNLDAFWYKADMEEYFKLFADTFRAIKEVDPRFRVGGPAVCGGSDKPWVRGFMEFCRRENISVDFITRHHYCSEPPEYIGHYGYIQLADFDRDLNGLRGTREIVDSFEEYKGLEIHVTEFNTSYTPTAPVHDTNQNAAYIAYQLSRLGDDNTSYSYWTFGDVFEEQGVPFTPFYGGFGLVANGCIPKPTFWTFSFFKRLKELPGHCVYRDGETLVMKLDNGAYRIVAWNKSMNRTGRKLEISYSLEVPAGEYCIVQKLVDENTCNPLKVWHNLGEPAHLSKEQKALLQNAAKPLITTERVGLGEAGKLSFDATLEEHGVIYVEVFPAKMKSDRGYSYERVMQYPENGM